MRTQDSFFSSVLDDSRRAAWRIQDGMSEAGDRAADWYEYEKAQARDWLGRVKHSAAKTTDRMADELSAGYYRAKGKASGAYHDAASQYYRTKADLRSAGRSMDEWKHRIQDAVTSSVDDPVAEDVERVKMRQWMREVERALETEPGLEPQYGFQVRGLSVVVCLMLYPWPFDSALRFACSRDRGSSERPRKPRTRRRKRTSEADICTIKRGTRRKTRTGVRKRPLKTPRSESSAASGAGSSAEYFPELTE